MAVGTGGGIALPDFNGTVIPISTRGTDYAHHITTSPYPLQIFRTSYGSKYEVKILDFFVGWIVEFMIGCCLITERDILILKICKKVDTDYSSN